MRKYIKSLMILLIASLSIICFPKYASAEEDLYIKDWVVDANLEANGDLRISEDITFEFNKKFNGVYRDIVLKGTSGIRGIEVGMVDGNSLLGYKEVNKAKNGDEGVYTIDEKDGRLIIKIFSPAKDESKTFRLNYIVKNVAVKYKDTGELYYKFLGDENKTSIGRFIVNIHFNQNDKDNMIRVYAHGPLNGKIDKVNNQLYRLTVDNLAAKRFVEGRLLFPTEFIKDSDNIQNVNKYQDIIDEEAALAKKHEEDRIRKENTKRKLEKISIVVSAIGVFVFIIILYQCKRNINKEILNLDYRDIPKDISPALAAHITGMYSDSNAMFATILDLNRRGYLRISGENEELDVNENTNFIIHKLQDNYISLLDHEKHFMSWLFDEMGNGYEVSTDDIKKYNKHNWQKYNALESAWKKKIKEEADRHGYRDYSKKGQGTIIIVISLIIIVLGIITAVFGSLNSMLDFLVGAVLLIYGITLFNRLSDKGYMEYKKWMSFKKNVNKYNPDLSKEEALATLDPTLIYALSLNVIKQGYAADYDGAYSTNSWIFWYVIFASGNDNSFYKSINRSFAGDTSTSSSISFSAGGGGGAGGGGAGGF